MPARGGTSDHSRPGLIRVEPLKKALGNILARLDAWFNRLYGWRLNPLYQSGSLVLLSLVIMLVTGLYLLLFYRIGSPADSVARITEQVWVGRWVRSLHRYAADVAVVAAALHAVRMLIQGRSWGPRALAWLSGLFLVFLLYVCGWTGYVMVWDRHGQILAVEGARLLDGLPIFAQPIARTFTGEAPLPSAFFFLNLFLHIAVPIAMVGALWLHVSRVSRPVLLPPKIILWGATAAMVAVSVAWPVPMYPAADLLALPDRTVIDILYSFWLPMTEWVSPGGIWGLFLAGTAALAAIPLVTRPKPEEKLEASRVEARFCTGCEQCYLDCPYDAIRMVPRRDGRDYELAVVDPALCVSCGICSGSCAPMSVGPPLRTGRDQLGKVKEFLAGLDPQSTPVVAVTCDRSAGAGGAGPGVPVYSVACTGNLHTSVIEYIVRSGVGGVLVATCPPRDCWSREGSIWLDQRVFHDREAELKDRVDKRRVRIAYAGAKEDGPIREALARFTADLARLDGPDSESEIEIDLECATTEPGVTA